MGDSDGFGNVVNERGKNKTVEFKGGYFSFAFGDEIALILEELPNNFFILNCDNDLWENVKRKIKLNDNINDIKAYWYMLGSKYKKSRWSDDFKLLDNFEVKNE